MADNELIHFDAFKVVMKKGCLSVEFYNKGKYIVHMDSPHIFSEGDSMMIHLVEGSMKLNLAK